MPRKIFTDALMQSVSADAARGSLCGICIDAVTKDRRWIRFVATDGHSLQVVKASQTLEKQYNEWANEHRLPKWDQLRKGMILVPWIQLKRLGITETYLSPSEYGKSNPYPDWRKLMRPQDFVMGTNPPGWFSDETLSVLSTAKRILTGSGTANFIPRAWVSAMGMHIDKIREKDLSALLIGMPLRILGTNGRDAEDEAREKFDETMKACDDVLMAA